MRGLLVVTLFLLGCPGPGPSEDDAGTDAGADAGATVDAGSDAGTDAGTPPRLFPVSFHYYYVQPGSCPTSDVRVGCSYGGNVTEERFAALVAMYPSCRATFNELGGDIDCSILNGVRVTCSGQNVACAAQGVYRQAIQCPAVAHTVPNDCSWTPP